MDRRRLLLLKDDVAGGTPKSSSSSSEVADLKYRISQLEHLVVSSTLSSSSSFGVGGVPPDENLLLLERVSTLESLLAASESEVGALRESLRLSRVEKNRAEVTLLEQLYAKDGEKRELEAVVSLLQVQLDKAQGRLGHLTDYLQGLPSEEELEEARGDVDRLQGEGVLLQGKLVRMEDALGGLQKDLAESERERRALQLRLEELRPLEEAQEAVLKDAGGEDLVDLDPRVLDLLTHHKASALRSAKVASLLRKKLASEEAARASDAVKMTTLKSELAAVQEALREAGAGSEALKGRLRTKEETVRGLEGEVLTLKSRVQGLEGKESRVEGLIHLAAEVDLTVKDVERVLEVGKALMLRDEGEGPSLGALLGLDEDIEKELLSEPWDPSDEEWILTRLVRIRGVRKEVNALKDGLVAAYTDETSAALGGGGCAIQ